MPNYTPYGVERGQKKSAWTLLYPSALLREWLPTHNIHSEDIQTSNYLSTGKKTATCCALLQDPGVTACPSNTELCS